ncbi:MAG: MFS transporter [Chloroflexota bacterium]
MTTLVSSAGRVRALPIWRATGIRDFRLLWASEAVSVLGDQFHFVALSWLVISLTGSGLALGTVLIAVGVPRAILLVPMGVIADRRSPRTLMLAAHLARGAIVAVIAVLVATDRASIPALAVLGALFGAVDAAYLPAQQAFLPRAVGPDRLPPANALLQGTLQLASIAGPPVAGFAIAIVGTGTAFAVDAASFAIAGALVALITGGAVAVASTAARPGTTATGATTPPDVPAGATTPTDVPTGAAATAPESFADALRGGVRYVLADPGIRLMMLLSLVLNFAVNGPAAVGMAWLAERRFDAGPTGLGFMAAGWAAGALAGTIIAGNVRLERQGRIVLACIAVSGLAMAAVGVLGWLPAVVGSLAVMGVAIGYVNVVAISWLQARVELDMLGRVMSLAMLMGFGITPLSIGLAGALIDADATALFVGAGGLVLATVVLALALRFPAMLDGPARVPAPVAEAPEPAEAPISG